MTLVKLLNENLLKNEGLELKKLVVDFLEDYTDESVHFLQITSYDVNEIPQASFNPYIENQFHHRT